MKLLALFCLLAPFLSWLIHASCNVQSTLYLRYFCRKRTRQREVILTFDDGPDPLQTPQVLRVLRAHGAPACFFCIGSKIKGNEGLLRQMVADGHLVGIHSYTHSSFFPFYRLSTMKKELQACQNEIERVTSQPVRLFRPPFGVTNPTVAKAVRQLGYSPIGWSIRTLDTCTGNRQKVLDRVRKGLCPGAVILLHDRLPGSDQLLEEIFQILDQRGYTVVPLNQPVAE